MKDHDEQSEAKPSNHSAFSLCFFSPNIVFLQVVNGLTERRFPSQFSRSVCDFGLRGLDHRIFLSVQRSKPLLSLLLCLALLTLRLQLGGGEQEIFRSTWMESEQRRLATSFHLLPTSLASQLGCPDRQHSIKTGEIT